MATGLSARYIAPMRQYLNVDNIVRMKHYTVMTSVLMGAGMAYAISEEKYLHTPVIFLVPSVYAGYQTYKNRETVASFVKETLK